MLQKVWQVKFELWEFSNLANICSSYGLLFYVHCNTGILVATFGFRVLGKNSVDNAISVLIFG